MESEPIINALLKEAKRYRVLAMEAFKEGAGPGSARYERTGGEEFAACHMLAVAMRASAGMSNEDIGPWMERANDAIENAPHPNVWQH